MIKFPNLCLAPRNIWIIYTTILTTLLLGSLPNFAIKLLCVSLESFLLSIPPNSIQKGVGQLTFMESTVGGIGLLAGLAYFSPMTASSCLVGSILSIMWARFLKLDYDLIKCGAIAFNGVLVVAGAPFFLTPIEAVLFVSFFGPALAVYLFDRACKHLSFPVLTLPFVLTESLALLSTKFNIGVNPTFDFSSGPLPKFADLTQMDVLMTKIATAIPMSITQLCFTKDPSVTFGALFIGLLAYLDPKNALSAVSGATIGCIAGALLGYDFNNMLLMWGLNCALTSMALFPYFGKSYTTSVIGAVATAAIYPFFIYLSTKIGLLAFTAPFCVTTILMLKLKFLK